MKEKTSWIVELNETLEKQIALGVEAVFSGVFSGPNPSTQSFHHILNRVMTVAQVPITFIVYQRILNEYTRVYVANKHKRHEGKIKAQYEDALPYVDDMFSLWGEDTGYYVLVINADPGYEFNVVKKIISLDMVEDSLGAASYMLHRIFNVDTYGACGKRFSDYLKATLRNFNNENRTNIIDPTLVNKELKGNFDKWLKVNATSYDVKGRGIIDRVYSKLEKNILLITHADAKNPEGDRSSSADRLTNFILFVRDYDLAVGGGIIAPSSPGRYGGDYRYNLRIMIGSKQSAEIRRHLISWVVSEDEKKKRKNKYINQIEGLKITPAKNLALEVNELFWRILCEIDDQKSGDSKYIGVDKILNILTEYFGDSRSMADPVFDGVSFFRTPFANDGGMGRGFRRSNESSPEEIPSSLEDVKTETIGDLLRIVTCQYIFDSMATSTQDSDELLQVMLSPLEVGGRVWGVVGYVTRCYGVHNKIRVDGEDELVSISRLRQYHSYWLQNYHVAEIVNERVKKNLRTYLSRAYEWFVADIYSKWVARQVVGEGAVSSQQLSELNKLLLDLVRVFPYDAVKMSMYNPGLPPRGDWGGTWFVPRSEVVLEGDRSPGEETATAFVPENARVVPLALGKALCVDAQAVSCFQDTPGGYARGFVDEVDVAVAMTDAMQAKVLSLAVEYEQTLQRIRPPMNANTR